MRKRVSCRSEGNKFSTFSAFFVDFVSSSFFNRFRDLLRTFWTPFDTIFEKKTLPKIASKKGAPLSENKWLCTCPGAPREAASYYFLIKATASRAHFSNRIQFDSSSAQFNSIRFQLELELWFEFVFDFSSSSSCGSNLCPNLSWLEFEIESKNCSKMAAWVGFDSIAKVSKTIRNWIGFDCESFVKNSKKWKGLIAKLNARDLTRHWAKGPANSVILIKRLTWRWPPRRANQPSQLTMPS